MMHKRPTRYFFLALAGCTLMGCGNKGDLFLAPDEQLAGELNSVTERIADPASDSEDDELPEKSDKPVVKKKKP